MPWLCLAMLLAVAVSCEKEKVVTIQESNREVSKSDLKAYFGVLLGKDTSLITYDNASRAFIYNGESGISIDNLKKSYYDRETAKALSGSSYEFKSGDTTMSIQNLPLVK